MEILMSPRFWAGFVVGAIALYLYHRRQTNKAQ